MKLSVRLRGRHLPATKQHSETCSIERMKQVRAPATFRNIKAPLKHEFLITDFEEPATSKNVIEKKNREFEFERVPRFSVIGSKKQ